MAEERSLNGDATTVQEDDSFLDSDGGKSAGKIGDLESRNQELERENGEISKRIEALTAEVEEMRGAEAKARRKMGEMEREIDKSEEEKKVLEAIAERSSELETEKARLRDELVAAQREREEAESEAKKLRDEIAQKRDGIEEVEKEVVALRSGKEENEKRMKELEGKLGALEAKELEERNKKVRAEEEMRDRIDNKEKEVDELKEKIKGLESNVAEGKAELEKWRTEKNSTGKLGRKLNLKGEYVSSESKDKLDESHVKGPKKRTYSLVEPHNQTRQVEENGRSGAYPLKFLKGKEEAAQEDERESIASSVGSCCSMDLDGLSTAYFGTRETGNSSDTESSSCGGYRSIKIKKLGFPAADVHRQELDAYRSSIERLHASSGPNITWEQETWITNLRLRLNISNEEHLVQIRNLISDDDNSTTYR